MALAETLRDFIHRCTLDGLPADIAADGKRRLLDTVGLALAAADAPLGRAVLNGARAMGGGSGARALGSGAVLAPADAALVNGTLAHAMDFDDTHLPSLVHPSAPVIAAALAAGEAADASGADVLAAVIAGNEAACRLGMAAPGAFHKTGLHPTGVLCAPVAALVAARLFGLSADAALHAAGIACSQASGILESYADGTWVKTLHPGWAAHAGIAAARLAGAGFTGPASGLDGRFGLLRSMLDGPDTVLDLDAVAGGLGDRWESRANFYKIHPCAQVILPVADLALAWRAEGLDPASIDAIALAVPARVIPVVCEPRDAKIAPRTGTHARASLAWCTARALLHGDLGIDAFGEAAAADPAVRALAAKATHGPLDPEPDGAGFAGALTLTFTDGRSERRTALSRRGHPQEADTPAAIDAKFTDCAGRALAPDRVTRLAAAIAGVEALPRIADLVSLSVAD